MPTLHSRLGPSGAHRWGACPGSVNAERIWKLSAKDPNPTSPFAEEGTRAHDLAERLLNNPELPEPGDDIDTMEDVDMLRHVLRYRDYCLDLTTPTSLQWVEAQVKMPAIHKDCFGTSDFACYVPGEDHLHVVDLKYGAGQYVEVEKNPQALMYAEGMRYMLFKSKRINPKRITVHIFQPRLMQGENIASYTVTNLQLNDFVHRMATAAQATETEIDTFVPGDKQCHWCLANPCKARQQQVHELFAAELEDLDDAVSELSENSPLMDDSDVAAWLDKISPLKSFISKVEAIAYERAMDHHRIPGFKLVEGRGSYTPNVDAIEFVLGPAAYRDPEVKSQTELKRDLGTKRFEALVKPLYKRQPGKPTLVKESDKRSEWSETADVDAMLEDL